jgi:hypothetical protein
VLIPSQNVALESQKSIAGDTIQFIATGNNIHFMQFVTHQYCDKAGWSHHENFHIIDPKHLNWRVDGDANSDKGELSQ